MECRQVGPERNEEEIKHYGNTKPNQIDFAYK
jgi:hypothetical protein